MHEFTSNLTLKFLIQKVIQKLNKKKKEMKIFWPKLLLPLNLKLLQALRIIQMSLQEYSQNPSQELNLQLLAVDPNQPLKNQLHSHGVSRRHNHLRLLTNLVWLSRELSLEFNLQPAPDPIQLYQMQYQLFQLHCSQNPSQGLNQELILINQAALSQKLDPGSNQPLAPDLNQLSQLFDQDQTQGISYKFQIQPCQWISQAQELDPELNL